MNLKSSAYSAFCKLSHTDDRDRIALKKGLKHSSLTKYQIAYLKSDPSFLNRAIEEDKELFSELVKLDVIGTNGGLLQYKFNSHFIFPLIRDDEIIAFVGENDSSRVLSSNSKNFNPLKTFFASEQNVKSSIEKREAFIVNSCFDVVALHEFGISNVLYPLEFSQLHMGFFIENSITPVFIIDKDNFEIQNDIISCISSGIYCKTIDKENVLTDVQQIDDAHLYLANSLASSIESSSRVLVNKTAIDSSNAIYNLEMLFERYHTPFLNESVSLIKETLMAKFLFTAKQVDNIINFKGNEYYKKNYQFDLEAYCPSHKIIQQNSILLSFLEAIAKNPKEQSIKLLLSQFYPITSEASIYKKELLKATNIRQLLDSSFDLSIYADFNAKFIALTHRLINEDNLIVTSIETLSEEINKFHECKHSFVKLNNHDSVVPIYHEPFNIEHTRVLETIGEIRTLSFEPSISHKTSSDLLEEIRSISPVNNKECEDSYLSHSQERLIDMKI